MTDVETKRLMAIVSLKTAVEYLKQIGEERDADDIQCIIEDLEDE